MNIAQGLPLGQLCPENFCLATLGPVLRRLAQDVAHGRGFFAFRGLDPSRYSKSRNIVIYVGIASYIGNRCGRQDEYGNMLCQYAKVYSKMQKILTPAVHLTDLGSTAAPDNERQAPYSSVGQVSIPSSPLKPESNKLVRWSSRSTPTRAASLVCTLSKKPPMEAKAKLPLLGISTISFEGSGQI